MRSCLILLALCFGCGADTPVPEYPFPEPAPLEETDLAEFVEDGELEEDYEEDEEWDDGLDDEDLEMDSGGDAAEPAAEAGQPSISTTRLECALRFTLGFWIALVFVMHAKGFSAHGVPAVLADDYYALQGVFLPFVAALQLFLGTRALGGGEEAHRATLASLAFPPLFFLVPDAALVAAGQEELLPYVIRGAGPLAALLCAFFLVRAGGMHRGSLAWVAVVAPAAVFVR